VITHSQKVQRRVVFHLVLISGALFVLSAVTDNKVRDWDSEANDALRMRRIHTRSREPKTPKSWAPGERTTIPLFVEAREKPELEVQEDVVVEPDGAPPAKEVPAGLLDVEEVDVEIPEPLAGEALVAAIQATVSNEVRPKVMDCLHMWWMLDPKLSGRVVVGLQLGPEGLGASWIQDHNEVPLGPLTCFGSVLTETDWPWAAEETEVHFPFLFDAAEQDTAAPK
jgi:hypothetical protein